ncbi:MAG: LD-carboxypeptidase [Firmicutes bacterium]|nr:LD-carboxypeptidase [Bacillota bacterium]
MHTIGVFSSSICGTAQQEKQVRYAIDFLEARGWHVKPGALSGTGAKRAWRAGSIAERAAEFNALLRDPEVDCLMASAGGCVSNSILPYIDYNFLRAHPKKIIGFSDITALVLGIYAQTGLTTYYGPVFSMFWHKPPINELAFSYMEPVLSGAPRPFTLPTPAEWTDENIHFHEKHKYHMRKNALRTLRGGAAEGCLLPCNLNTLSGIWGSPYMPEIRPGDILLLEDTKKDTQTAERSLSHLKLCGVFDKIGGLLFGKHIDQDDEGSGLTDGDVFLEIAGRFDFPVLAEFDCSHAMPMLTLPVGAPARLDADRQTLTLL